MHISGERNSYSSFTTPNGRATRDNEDMFRVGLDGRDALWIPEQAQKMQMRLMVYAHMKDAEHLWGSWRLCSV